ncbi:hypothetical protein AU488_14215 [Lonsdalea populi]|nr:hypothetical protein AU488_14215 [Lonsdalea populi]
MTYPRDRVGDPFFLPAFCQTPQPVPRAIRFASIILTGDERLVRKNRPFHIRSQQNAAAGPYDAAHRI